MHLKLDQTPNTKILELKFLYKVSFDQKWSVVKNFRENIFRKLNELKSQTKSQV